MALRAKSWACDSAGAPVSANAIVTEDTPHIIERVNVRERSSDQTYYRERATRNREWICMTEAGATGAADCMGVADATKTYTYSAVETDRILSAYKVVEVKNAIVQGWTGE